MREPTLEDVPSYTQNFVDYEVIRHLSHLVPWPYPENGAKDFLINFVFKAQGKTRWVWGLFLKTDPTELIGIIDLWRDGKPENRGFWLARKHWGKGLMTEAVQPVTDFAFKKLGFEKLVFANAVGNKASRRIKEKSGCRLVGVAPAKFVDPQYKEHEIWELTKSEWSNRRR